MTGVWKPALAGLAICAVIGGTGAARAQTVQSPLENGIFSYGNESFSITGCLYNGIACGASDDSLVAGLFNGRGGTEIEIASTTPNSAILTGSSTNNPTNDLLTFNLQITPKTGSLGLSSITNILSASDTNSNDSPSLVTSTLSGFSGVSGASASSVVSSIGSLTSTNTFSLTQNPVNFNVNIRFDSANAAGTLTLTNVALLLNPAPEPATIALFSTGVLTLAAARRRYRQSPQRRNIS